MNVNQSLANDAKVGVSGGSGTLFDSDNAKEVGDLFGGEMTHVADIDAEAVKPGHTYVDKAYAKVTMGEVTTAAGSTAAACTELFDIAYYADGDAI